LQVSVSRFHQIIGSQVIAHALDKTSALRALAYEVADTDDPRENYIVFFYALKDMAGLTPRVGVEFRAIMYVNPWDGSEIG
jgi:hypothetical protein